MQNTPNAPEQDIVPLRHRNLEQIAMAALDVGRLLMETGAKASVVNKGVAMVAEGLGSETVSIRIGYASLSATVRHGDNTITRMVQVGHHGVNLRLNHATRDLCLRISTSTMSADDVVAAAHALRNKTQKHPWMVVALATGLACACFGQLLGADAMAFLPIWIAGCIGQTIRHYMLKHGQNMFAIVSVIAFVSSAIGGLLCSALGSETAEVAIFSSVLLLVPGVPAMNAQTDIMEGYPTLGSARAVTVSMVLIFLTVGVALSRYIVMGTGVVDISPPTALLHNAFFGAIAAAGFGILFNFSWKTVIWAALGGALALTVRTLGLAEGWSLAMASTLAAAVVTICVRLLYNLPITVATGGSMLALAGCIPMIPGAAAAKGIFGLLTLAGHHQAYSADLLGSAATAMMSVFFTIGGIGAGITLVNIMFKRPELPTD